MKTVKWLDEHFEEALMILMLVLISCVELIQVIIRNVPFIPALTWAEEFCRFCWIWSVFLSLPYTIKKGSMLRVSVLLDVFSAKVRGAINIVVSVITCLTMALMGYHSIEVIQRIFDSGETSPAMKWPMGVIYSIMLVGFTLAALRGIQQAVLAIRNFGKPAMSTVEQTMAEAAEEAENGKKAEGGNN